MRKDFFIYASWIIAFAVAVFITAGADGGPVKIMERNGVIIRTYSDSAHEQVQISLPDSLKAQIEAGQIENLQISHLDNWGWAYMHGDTGLMLPIHRGGIHLWPSPDGWVEHWFVNRTYWIAVRVNASAAQCTTVVALWRPSPSPSY